MEIEDREVARLLGLGRTVLGITMVLAPRKSVHGYVGRGDATSAAPMLMRAVGARDIALGTGILVALENDGDVARWLEAGAIADAGDFLSTLANFRELPTWRRLLWLMTSGGATFMGLKLAGALD